MALNIVVYTKGNPFEIIGHSEDLGENVAEVSIEMGMHDALMDYVEQHKDNFPLMFRMDDFFVDVEWRFKEVKALEEEVEHLIQGKVVKIPEEFAEWLKEFLSVIKTAEKYKVSVFALAD